MPKIQHDYTPKCEFKIVLPPLCKRSSGVFILPVFQNQTPSLEALWLLKYPIRFTIGQLVKSTHPLNRWTMTSANLPFPILQVKLLNSWSCANSRVPRAPSRFPNYVDPRVRATNVRIKGKAEVSKQYHQSLTPYGLCPYPLGWFNYKPLETCFSVVNLGLTHRINFQMTY